MPLNSPSFRLIFACYHSSDPTLRADAIECVRNPVHLRELITLCDTAGNDTVATAKLACILSDCLSAEPHEPVISMDMLTPLGITMR